jgi:DNA replication protein DnaC
MAQEREEQRVAAEESARQAAEQKARVEQMIANSGIEKRYQTCTFDGYEVNVGNKKAFLLAKRYAEVFETLLPSAEYEGKNGLFFCGPVGTGKTHLSSAIAMEVMRKGYGAICMTMVEMLGKIRKSFSDSGLDEWEIIEWYINIPLLVIDDLGKEVATEWAISTVYKIIDGRYQRKNPTIITSNYGEKQLAERLTPKNGIPDSTTAISIVDRLIAMCKKVELTGKSYRR